MSYSKNFKTTLYIKSKWLKVSDEKFFLSCLVNFKLNSQKSARLNFLLHIPHMKLKNSTKNLQKFTRKRRKARRAWHKLVHYEQWVNNKQQKIKNWMKKGNKKERKAKMHMKKQHKWTPGAMKWRKRSKKCAKPATKAKSFFIAQKKFNEWKMKKKRT